MTPDVNVLVAAFRPDHPHHRVAHAWLEGARASCAEGRATLVLLPMVVTGFLRLVTNARVFVEPDAVEDALTFIDVLTRLPGIELQSSGSEWPPVREKLLSLRLHGNPIIDA